MSGSRKRKIRKKKNSYSSNSAGEVSFISLGEPESVLSSSVLSQLGTFLNPTEKYYIPPIDMEGLSKMRGANAHHGSAIIFRRNMLANAYIKNPYFSVVSFRNAETDLLTFGNAYLKRIYNHPGLVIGIEHVPAINMRVKRDNKYTMLRPGIEDDIEFKPDEIIHVKEYDTTQQIYGIPDWLSGMQAVLLNEDATLFRRKYYANGAHLGYVFYTNDAGLDSKTQTALEEKIRQSKGVGNFRSVYMHIPNGGEKAVQIIPVGDISQKDEFERIKNISSSDVLVAHRVNGAMMAILPTSQSGFGDLDKISANYISNEVRAMAQTWEGTNEVLPNHLHFKFNFTIPNLTGGSLDGKNTK